MLTEGKSIVRYIGPNPGLLNLHFQGSLKDPMTFAPDPRYGNQRVEVFRSHEDAQKFLFWQNRDQLTLFEIADDLILAGDREVVAKVVRDLLDPLLERVRALERKVEALEKRKGG